MQSKLGTWYKTANLLATNDDLKKRVSAIDKYLNSDIDYDDYIDLTRVFFNSSFSSKKIEIFTKHFYDEDMAFDINNKEEISVLAGITLFFLLNNQDSYDLETQTIVCLAIFCASFNERPGKIQDIQDQIIQKYLEDCFRLRENVPVTNQLSVPDLEKLQEAIKSEEDQWKGELLTYLTNLNVMFSKFIRHSDIYSDDSQVLWWMTGGWCNDLDKSFADLSDEACIYAGKELADLVNCMPGALSAKAVLSHVIGQRKKALVTELIDEMSLEHRLLISEKYNAVELYEITPILYAILLSSKFSEKGVWINEYEKQTGIRIRDLKIDNIDLSYQVYLECLLIKNLG